MANSTPHMSRAELSDSFLRTKALQHSHVWCSSAHNLLALILADIGKSKERSAIERAVLTQLKRIKRYLFALQRLSFPVESNVGQWIHLVDGAHAIHKSLFETYIEFALCLTYASLFNPEANENGDDLGQHLYLFADFAKRKRNRERLFRMGQWNDLMSRLSGDIRLSPGMEEFLAKGVEGVKEDLAEQAKRIGGRDARFAQLSHWFPEKRPDGRYFVKPGEDDKQRPRNCGSIEWASKAVLAEHFPDPRMREWWMHSYDQYYDILNLFAHPVLSYDDAFRRESERLLDLARMQIGIRTNFHHCVLPAMKAMFSHDCLKHQQHSEALDVMFQELSQLVLPYLLRVDQTDYNTP